jgi:hypothetical protein
MKPELKEYMSKIGRKGGMATKKRLGIGHYHKMSAKAVKIRSQKRRENIDN